MQLLLTEDSIFLMEVWQRCSSQTCLLGGNGQRKGRMSILSLILYIQFYD
ncbi:hypothetical protein [Lacibacter sp. H407]